MKAYLLVTGILFGLVAIAHLLRIFVEGHPASDPWFIGHNLVLVVVGGGFAVWAALLFMRQRKPPA